MEDSIQMMNFKINFDILKNKIARLNNLVPSMNNSNDYSNITQFAEQKNQNYDRFFEEAQERKAILNKMKMYDDYDQVSNNFNITDYHTLIYNNNAIMLESKSCLKASKKRKNKERENNMLKGCLNNESTNRHTINFGLNGIRSSNNLNRKNSNVSNSNRNCAQDNSRKTIPNMDNPYLNTSVDCCDLFTESVTQFSISPSNMTSQAVRLDKDEKSNSISSKSKSCSFNLSDIVDDIIKIKNTPTKAMAETDINILNNRAYSPSKYECDVDDVKGKNLHRDLGTKKFRTLYDRSKEEEFFHRIKLNECKIEQSISDVVLSGKEDIKAKIVVCEKNSHRELINKEEEKIETVQYVDEVVNNKSELNFETEIIQTIFPENLPGLEIKPFDKAVEANVVPAVKDSDDNFLSNEENNIIAIIQPNDPTDIISQPSPSLQIEEPNKSSSELEQIQNDKSEILISPKLEHNDQEEITDKVEAIPHVESLPNSEEVSPNLNEDDQEVSPNFNEEDEEDYEADLIINEIIKNSKLKYEQELLQQQYNPLTNKENISFTKEQPDNIIKQDEYFKCNEEKIEIRESLNNCIDKSVDESLIFVEGDDDPNTKFDIKDQLCSDNSSKMIIEDVIEKSLIELSYSLDSDEKNECDPENCNSISEKNSDLEIKSNLTTDNYIVNRKDDLKNKKKKNVIISKKVTFITYEHKSCVKDLYKRKSDGSILKLKVRDMEEYLKKLYKNKKPKSILKKFIPNVDTKELALKKLTALITEFDDSKESDADTVNHSKSVPLAKKKIICKNYFINFRNF